MAPTMLLFLIPLYLVQCERFNATDTQTCQSEEINCTYQNPGALNRCVIKKLNVSNNSPEQDCIDKYLQTSNFHEQKGSDVFEVVPDLFSIVRELEVTNLNISLTIGEGVQGILLWIEIGHLKSCRGIELEKKQAQGMLTLWYDCMYFYKRETGLPYSFKIISFPKQEMKTFLGKALEADFRNNITKWEFPIFIEVFPNLPKIHVLFYESPLAEGSNYNYTVQLSKLRKKNDTVLEVDKEVKVNSHKKATNKEPFNITFDNFETDVDYVVNVMWDHPSCLNRTCKNSLSPHFRISSDKKLADVIILPTMITLGIFSLLFVLFLFLAVRHQRRKNKEETEVLILYSYDNKYHVDLVKTFVHLLRHRGFIVHFDLEVVMGNPLNWLKKYIFMENIRIILIWSKGAIYKAKQAHPLQLKTEPGNLTSHLFQVSLKYIQTKIAKSQWNVLNYSNIICILWDKSHITEVSKLVPELPVYHLPAKWHSLLYHLDFIKNPNLQFFGCCSKFQQLFSEDLKASPEGKAFLKAFIRMSKKEEYIDFESNNCITQEHAIAERSSSAENNHNSNSEESGYYSLADKQIVTSSPDVRINDTEQLSSDSDSELDSDEENWLTQFVEKELK